MINLRVATSCMTHFLEAIFSNFDEGTDYIDWDVSWFCSDPKTTTWMCFNVATTAYFHTLSDSLLFQNIHIESPIT
jgi:hypothetical protein